MSFWASPVKVQLPTTYITCFPVDSGLPIIHYICSRVGMTRSVVNESIL